MLRLVCLFVVISVCYSELSLKNLAGPPSDFGLYILPSPIQSADVQNSATFQVDLLPSGDSHVLSQTLNMPVDSQLQFGFTFYSPYEGSITLSLQDPNGHNVKLQGTKTYYPFGDEKVPGTDYRFKNPKSGLYVLTIKTNYLGKDLYNLLSSNTVADAFVVLWNEDALSTHTMLNTYSLLTNSKVGLVTRVFNTSFASSFIQKGMAPQALRGAVHNAEMSVVFPDGTVVATPMSDNGLNFDGAADDGVYGALITASVPGQYIFSATLTGMNDGLDFIRTTQQLVSIVNPTVTLVGNAISTLDQSKTRINILIGATTTVGNKYRAYAEVWGQDSTGKEIAVAWIGGMTFAQATGEYTYLPLELDLNWVTMAGAQEPLTLKNVVVQEPENFVPVAEATKLPVKSSFSILATVAEMKASLIGPNGQITAEMLEGRRPISLQSVNASAASAVLVISHGYCSDANPFQSSASDFTNAKFYLNSKKNLPHDTFAQNVLAWAKGFGAFSWLGHSQGGAVGLHIKNYYWSGLDQVSDGRILQSVGTPYQGSSGAGTAANLAKLFGVTCGANTDLTKDGSSLWLKGISAASRAKANYYTTTYVQGKALGDWCNLATNLVLDWPNDGVSEQGLAQLSGGVNKGNKEGWCHSSGMKYTNQCEDRERNKEMNAAAARKIV